MNRYQLLTKAQATRSEMRRLENLLQASVVLRSTKCGKPGCRCNDLKPHTSLSVTYKEKNKTRTICIDPQIKNEVLEWAKNWKRFRRLLKQHNAMLLGAIRKRGTPEQP